MADFLTQIVQWTVIALFYKIYDFSSDALQALLDFAVISIGLTPKKCGVQKNRLLKMRWQGPDCLVLNASVEVKESDSGRWGSNPTWVYFSTHKYLRPACHSRAIVPTLLDLCLFFC